LARRRRMLAWKVSGKKRSIMIKIGPESQSISHIDQRQFSAVTEKPEMIGPSAGLWSERFKSA
jgi:hypothetical protein